MGLGNLSVESFRHFSRYVAIFASLVLSVAPATAQDRPPAPDLANLIAQPPINIPSSLSAPVPANPYDDRVPLRSPSYGHPAEELNIPDPITKLLALPEDKIDIGTAALTFAHEIYPDRVDVTTYSMKLDQLAAKVRKLVGSKYAYPVDT